MKILKNRKGISSLYITIYVLLLTIILISTIFVGLTISNSSLTSYYRIENERKQESISIQGPGGLELDTTGTTVISLRVQNLGEIAVNIRALYIGESFKCDPSTFGDSYIGPKETLWINFVGHKDISYTETKNLVWTVTTERGSASQEKGEHILNGGGDTIIDTDILRFGPFALSFEDFHWKNSATWQPGWSIPKSTKNVIWQVNVTNIDKDGIILDENSCFVVAGNVDDSNSRLFWFLSAAQNGLLLHPDDNVDLLFNLNSAGGGGSMPDLGKFQSGTSCYNLLVLVGHYESKTHPGTPDLNRPLVQTIPFEAVLVT